MEHFIIYKASQDIIEIFFGLLRAKLGHNNNPTAYQLEITYKNVLSIKKFTTLNNGNCHQTTRPYILFYRWHSQI